MHDTDTELLQTLLLGFDRAMLVSRRGDALHARPVSVAQTGDSKRLWLLSGIAGDRLEELAHDPNVNVVLQDGLRFCSVSGTARVARHASENPVAYGVAPGGSGSSRSSLLLVQVTPLFAEYWDRSGSRGLKFETVEVGESCAPVAPSPFRHGDRGARGSSAKVLNNVIPLERARWKK
jgi:pyridoxamine 5'-phosphate oxidase like protein